MNSRQLDKQKTSLFVLWLERSKRPYLRTKKMLRMIHIANAMARALSQKEAFAALSLRSVERSDGRPVRESSKLPLTEQFRYAPLEDRKVEDVDMVETPSIP